MGLPGCLFVCFLFNLFCSCWLDVYAFWFAFMLPVIVVVALNSGLFLYIVVSLCRRKVALHTNQTWGQRKRLQVSASVACFVVSGKLLFINYC